MLELLIKRHQERERQAFIRTGMICTAVINSGFARPDKPVKVEDFVPGCHTKDRDLTDLSPDEQAFRVRQLFAPLINKQKE